MKTEYLLRYGELVLKSRRVRDRMIRRLLSNLQDAMARNDIPYTLHQRWDRLILETTHPEKTETVLSHLFGLRSFSRIYRCPLPDRETLVLTAESYFRPHVQGRTFAVRARRTREVPISTRELERTLGARLVQLGGRVDLEHPDVTCRLDLRQDEVWFYLERSEAPGGLPLGVEPRALALISGGYDSPVAAWRMLRKGVPLDFLFVALGGCVHLAPVLEVLNHLYHTWIFGDRPRLWVVPGEAVVWRIQERVKPAYWNVMLKRVFYRLAEALARREGYAAAVTGEALGQVSSQTLSSLKAIEQGVDLPVLRPLLTEDKERIIQEARRVGTEVISRHVEEYCAITPAHPVTRPSPDRVRLWEKTLDMETWVVQLLEQAELRNLHEIDPLEIHQLRVSVDHPAPDMVWIDLRPEGAPPLPQPARRMQPAQLVQGTLTLPQGKRYLLICERGQLGADVAWTLRERGVEAYALRGGARRLLRREPSPARSGNGTVHEGAAQKPPGGTQEHA